MLNMYNGFLSPGSRLTMILLAYLIFSAMRVSVECNLHMLLSIVIMLVEITLFFLGFSNLFNGSNLNAMDLYMKHTAEVVLPHIYVYWVIYFCISNPMFKKCKLYIVVY